MSHPCNLNTVRPTPADAALADLKREAACRKATGTGIVIVTMNQGGFTSASYGILEKKKT